MKRYPRTPPAVWDSPSETGRGITRTVVGWIVAGLALGYVAHTLIPRISSIQQVFDHLAH